MWGAVGSVPLSASHSRVRLRAPDEVESEASAAASAAGRGAASGATEPAAAAFQPAVPHLDVGSPDYIEERLENLKRRPTWASYLDQYVEAFPDDDDEEAEPEERLYYAHKARYQSTQRYDNLSGFLASLMWSMLALALWPILLLLYPFLRHKGHGFWPMGCSSMSHLLSRSVLNVIFLLFGLLLLYWAICRDLTELDMENVLIRLDVRLAHLLDAGYTCQMAMQQLEVPLVRELCTGVGVDTAFVVATGWLVFHCHRRWARHAMVAMAVTFFFDGPTRLYDATFPAPMINHIDPTYAMVDEEITIALDGQNLKPEGHIAWVSYWGCATTSDVAVCEKQFSSVFRMGVVHVTFKAIDHFIPCYRDPPNPLKAQEYVCFPDVRVRVKDKQSIPGWSKIQQPTPAPAVVPTPNAASTTASAVSIEASKQSALVDDNANEEEEHAEEPSTLLEDDIIVVDDASNSDQPALGSTNQAEQPTPDDDPAELLETDDTHAINDEGGVSANHDLGLSSHAELPTPDNGQAELNDLLTDDPAIQPPDAQQHTNSNESLKEASHTTLTSGEQEAEIATIDVQATFNMFRSEKEGDEIDEEAEDFVKVEAQTVVELLEATKEKTVAVGEQDKVVEVEIAAEDPSSLTLVAEEVSSSPVSVQPEPKPVTTSELQPTHESLKSEAKLASPIKQEGESEAGEYHEITVIVGDTSATTKGQEEEVAPMAASVGYEAVKESSGEVVQGEAAKHIMTTQHDVALVESQAKSSVVALDDGKVEIILEQKPSEEKIARHGTQVDPIQAPSQPSEEEVMDAPAQKDGLKRKPSEAERSTLDSQRDRRRVQEREPSSISSIRVDRRGSPGLPRSSRQSSSTTAR